MIKIQLLQKLLNVDASELKNIDTERLRTLLGIFRYFVRLLEREINNRCSIRFLGGQGIEETQNEKKSKNKK